MPAAHLAEIGRPNKMAGRNDGFFSSLLVVPLP